jgi:hypothetical protein
VLLPRPEVARLTPLLISVADDPASYPVRRLDDGSLLIPIGLIRVDCVGATMVVRVVEETAPGLGLEITVTGEEVVGVGAWVAGWEEVTV